MAKNPKGPGRQIGDASLGYSAPPMSSDLTFKSMGSTGLRQFSGWVREEFLPQLVGRQAARVYREMQDNSPTVGAIIFAIQQSMRQVDWRVTPPADSPECMEKVEFVESIMDDMSTSWSDFVAETLTMLPYGYAPHEIIYKRRLGRAPKGKTPEGRPLAGSKFDDGLIGLRSLPIRGQDTILKWFFDPDGEITGLTQQPWVGRLTDIPAQKLLLFRPKAHKNNPEGYSILRTAYRPYYFTKRLEEQEAVYLERMSGTPEYTVPNALLLAAAANPPDPAAMAALTEIKRIITNIRIDEQMGLIRPSDTYLNTDGSVSSVPQYGFSYVMPQGSRTAANFDPSIERYKLDIMTSVLADFLTLGHSSRGTQSLADTKVDLFFQAIEGWLASNADVLNNVLLPRLWTLNNFDFETMPAIEPDMPQRVDLDALGNFVLQLSQAGMPLFPNPQVENYLLDVAGLPELSEEALHDLVADHDPAKAGDSTDAIQKHLAGMLARRMVRKGMLNLPTKKRRRRRG